MTARRVRALSAGGVAGMAGGLFGVGGGIILVPILTGWFQLPQHRAHGTSLAVVGATALVSVVVYGLHGNVAWATAALVGLASVISARWGARLAARTPPDRLAMAFAVLLVVVAVRMLWQIPAGENHLFDHPLAAAATDLGIGLCVGLLAGYMGVGGGIIAVPAFTLLLGMSQQVAQGTSLAVILVTAPFGAFEHHRHGNVVLAYVPPFAIGAALGGPLASVVAQQLPQEVLTRAFAVFILLNAVHLWIRSERLRRIARLRDA